VRGLRAARRRRRIPIGGLLTAAGLSIATIFVVLAGLALIGVLLALVVPASNAAATQGLAAAN
jgi:hypothetical protein